jgi:menaquinone-dependent protoporphyrinogen IX oxidase
VKGMRKALLTLLGIVLSWTIITIWVQLWDKSPSLKMTSAIGNKKALIVYNPDPIYNFDEQICRAFAEGIKENGYSAEVATHKQTPETLESFDLLVFCANTYNWAPDWKITSLINAHPEISGKPCIAITLGAGSTERAKRLLEEQILARRATQTQ